MRVTVQEYLQRNFSPQSAPSALTIRRMIQRGELPGEKFGNRYYVFEESTGDSLVDDIIKRRGM